KPTIRTSSQILLSFFDKKSRCAWNVCMNLKSRNSLNENVGNLQGHVDNRHIYGLLTLRGLLEDRHARNQSIPNILLEPLSLLLKYYCMFDPPDESKSKPEQIKSRSEANKMSALVDYRDDLLLHPFDICGQAFDGYENLSPPEDITCSEQRMCIAL